MLDAYTVKRVARNTCAPYVLGIHYAHRWPSISYAFGLFYDGLLVGVCTYGTPPSAPLKTGVCGDEYKDYVLELNRLCLKNNKKNEASILVGRSLQQLPNAIVVSFADISEGHTGYVYQACNFLYCGLSAKRTDWFVEGKEHLHGQTIADEFRGVENRGQAMRKKYGDAFSLKDRPRKHRYVYFTGSKSFKKRAKRNLLYEVCVYPKDDKIIKPRLNAVFRPEKDDAQLSLTGI